VSPALEHDSGDILVHLFVLCYADEWYNLDILIAVHQRVKAFNFAGIGLEERRAIRNIGHYTRLSNCLSPKMTDQSAKANNFQIDGLSDRSIVRA
jgi:hypothetical protein